ncbi:hypothetical protein ACFUN7_28130 [Streptomyces sp. NPDC057236]|uniref:hypothetical protein n=1 Tax=Streptomyces sp. NPDC057236 TaxID=3346059 RepID=UPI00363BB12C
MTTTGVLHERHRLIGRLVRDTAAGRTGILQAIAPDVGTDTPEAGAYCASTDATT